ncbi:MAG TPA: hypothetical protein VGT04_06170 [Acidobacteriaceae bacterium]|nr:hypothetical protein [Acidobacteriaceae bacterium]
MLWYAYIACFFAGAFLANSVPHFVKGICGESFPTPFAKPPGRGLSSPVVNVLWGILNIVIGVLLAHFGHLHHRQLNPVHIAFLAGFLIMSVMLSINFGKQHPR